MSASGRNLLNKLIPSAANQLQNIVETQRTTFWGSTQLNLRVRKYPKSKEERVSVVKPQINNVKLYSKILKKFVPLKISPEMLSTVESQGGLDAYLIKTPDRLLNSDVASRLRCQLLCAVGGPLGKRAAIATGSKEGEIRR